MYRVYTYENADIPYKHVEMFFTPQKGVKHPKRNTVGHIERLAESVSRSRRIVVDYGLCNPWEIFCTFTLNEEKVDRFDYGASSLKLTRFLEDFKRNYAPDFKYLIIPERHKNGAWHFHGLLMGLPASEFAVPDKVLKRTNRGLELVPNTKKYVSWKRYEKRLGWFNCSYIKDRNKVVFYILKYLMKDMKQFPVGRRIVLNSQGLRKPDLDTDLPGIGYMRGIKPDFENDFLQVKWDGIFDFGIGEWSLYQIEKIDNFKRDTGMSESQLSLFKDF